MGRFVETWVHENKKVDAKIIAVIQILDARDDLDSSSKCNLMAAKHFVSSELFLKKMELSFEEIRRVLEQMVIMQNNTMEIL